MICLESIYNHYTPSEFFRVSGVAELTARKIPLETEPTFSYARGVAFPHLIHFSLQTIGRN